MRRHHERPHRSGPAPREFALTLSLPAPGEWVEIHYRRPRIGVTSYRQLVLHSVDELIVTYQPKAEITESVLVDDRPVLAPGSPVIWFTIPGAWHDIGMFHLPSGQATGVYANILTPVAIETPTSWSTTDLYLDVWVPTQGPAQILDEEEFEEALSAQAIGPDVAGRARAEANRVWSQAIAGQWPHPSVSAWDLERAQAEWHRLGQA